jgi:hypothetical protein
MRGTEDVCLPTFSYLPSVSTLIKHEYRIKRVGFADVLGALHSTLRDRCQLSVICVPIPKPGLGEC